MENQQLINKFQKEIKQTEFAINHRMISNVKNMIQLGAVKTGAIIVKGIPVMLSATIWFNVFANDNVTPFKRDKMLYPLNHNVQTTSLGDTKTKSSYTISYNEFSLSFTTGWKQNDLGLYERTETIFKIDADILKKNLEEILNMSLEELEQYFIVDDIYTYEKSELDEEDQKITENMVIATYSYEDYNQAIEDYEGTSREVITIILYLILTVASTKGFKFIGNIIIKERVQNYLAKLETKYKYIKKEELEELKKSLKLKKRNLDRLTGITRKKERVVPKIKTPQNGKGNKK